MTNHQSTIRYLSCAETAKLLRANLKATFPGVKFSVRSHTYSGGASIDIYWTDGPAVAEVDAIAWLYRGATFDGMIDLKSSHDSLLAHPDGTAEVVHHGADFVFTNRTHSEGFMFGLETMTEPLNGRGSQCYPCGSVFDHGWLIPDLDRAWGCTPACAAKMAAQHVSAS